MTKKTRITILTLTAALILGGSLHALSAAGSSRKETQPQPAPRQQRDPMEQAKLDFNRALDYRDSAWELEAKAAENPQKAEKLLGKADKKYRKMENALRSAIAANPQMHEAYSSLGYALRKTGRFDEAVEAYDRALQLNPSYSEAIEYRAEAYLALGRLDDVKTAYMELFRTDRERADELMAAAKKWLKSQSAEGDGAVQDFAAWLVEREQIASQTAMLSPGSEDW